MSPRAAIIARESHQIIETYRIGLEAICPVRPLNGLELIELLSLLLAGSCDGPKGVFGYSRSLAKEDCNIFRCLEQLSCSGNFERMVAQDVEFIDEQEDHAVDFSCAQIPECRFSGFKGVGKSENPGEAGDMPLHRPGKRSEFHIG